MPTRGIFRPFFYPWTFMWAGYSGESGAAPAAIVMPIMSHKGIHSVIFGGQIITG